MDFAASSAPHANARNSVRRVMLMVPLALLPAAVLQTVYFGWGLPVQLLLAIVAALLFEALALKLRGRPVMPSLGDGSVVVTAVLFAFCMPPLAPWWLTVSGVAFAVLLAKHMYGGLGFNPFNPAMVGYAVLLVSFPERMSAWPAPAGAMDRQTPGVTATCITILTGSPPDTVWDAITMASPLATVRSGIAMGHTMEEVWQQPVFGSMAGAGWEWISLAILAGGLGLLAARIIRWHIPVAMLGTLATLAGLFHSIDPGNYPGVTFHLLSGGTMLGAFFIATDPVSAATSPRGRLVFGAGIGVLTYAIRSWGTYHDGVAFAVLLMNLAVPLIDRYTIPRIHGEAR